MTFLSNFSSQASVVFAIFFRFYRNRYVVPVTSANKLQTTQETMDGATIESEPNG